MNERKRLFLLIGIMTCVSLAVGTMTIVVLYDTAIEEERERLVETAQSQARLIEAIARFDAAQEKQRPGSNPAGSEAATLSQIVDAHVQSEGFGKTGEFTLARREGDTIVFLLPHRHGDLENPKPVRFDSDLAEPMRRALSGLSGTVVGRDYRGVVVLAAYEPVAVLNYGIVAKIDLSEIRNPFAKAVAFALSVALVMVLGGAGLFLRVSEPLIRRLEERAVDLASTNEQLTKEIQVRKEAEANLVESEERYSSMFKNNHSVMLLINPDTQDIEDANPAACSYYGHSKEILTQKGMSDINVNGADQCLWSSGRAQSKRLEPVNSKHVLASGEERNVEIYSSSFKIQGRTLMYSIVHDITKR